MEIKDLQKIMQDNGVVGAGGAGFPSYAKLTDKADTILLNCAECEPLLKLHRQLLEKHAYEIMKTFHTVMETVGASQAIIGIKKSYVQTVKALQQHIEEFPGLLSSRSASAMRTCRKSPEPLNPGRRPRMPTRRSGPPCPAWRRSR